MANARLLIVEDEAVVAMAIQSKLESMGYSIVDVARSGEAAVQLALQKDPDLILMDIRLQGEMDGVAAACQIRELRSIPVVFLTAHGDRETLQRAKTAEPFGYVLKPFTEQDLLAAVEISLHKHSMEVKRGLAQQERSKETVREITAELTQRHRELTALNASFQKHIRTKEEEDRNHQAVRSSVRELVNRIQELTNELDRRTQDNAGVL